MPRRPDVPCAGCGNLMWRGSSSLPEGLATCRLCRSAGQELRRKSSRKRCLWCGYPLSRGQTAYCSVTCSNQRTNDLRCQSVGYGRNPEVRRQSYQAKNRRRRARLRGVPTELYTLGEIATRDRWRCGLCHRKVRPDLRHPHPRSATIDHVVPLSCGGADVKANVQLAHRDCNIKKKAGGSQQLALIG